MKDALKKYHNVIISWDKEFTRLPKSNFVTSAVILSIGVVGLISLLILNPETLYFLSIFVASTIIGGIWFSMMLKKMLKLVRIRKDLKILMDFDTFESVINSVIKIRTEKKGIKSAQVLSQKLAEFGITSKYLTIELNRLVLDIMKNKH